MKNEEKGGGMASDKKPRGEGRAERRGRKGGVWKWWGECGVIIMLVWFLFGQK